jgi:hypothetical protein
MEEILAISAGLCIGGFAGAGPPRRARHGGSYADGVAPHRDSPSRTEKELAMERDTTTRDGFGPGGPAAAGDRDYMLGLMLMGVDAIQREGQERIAREMRHLIMTWYTQPGLRRGDLRIAPDRRKELPPR